MRWRTPMDEQDWYDDEEGYYPEPYVIVER